MTDNQNELFVVVDENDTVIDHRTRYDCHHDKSLIHRGIGVVLFNDKGEVLLQKRSKHKDTHPGYYDISVSGHCAEGETYEETALREMEEEIGIRTDVTFLTKKLIHFPEETEYDAFFKGKHNGPFTMNPQEIEKIEFISVKKLQNEPPQLTDFAKIGLQAAGVL